MKAKMQAWMSLEAGATEGILLCEMIQTFIQ